jgi:hypothetical protein
VCRVGEPVLTRPVGWRRSATLRPALLDTETPNLAIPAKTHRCGGGGGGQVAAQRVVLVHEAVHEVLQLRVGRREGTRASLRLLQLAPLALPRLLRGLAVPLQLPAPLAVLLALINPTRPRVTPSCSDGEGCD